MKKPFFFLVLFLSFLFACSDPIPSSNPSSDIEFSIASLKPIIKNRGKVWSKALTTKNIELLKGLYDDEAHYLPNDALALHGKEAILNYWSASFDFLGDLNLNMESLEGTKDLLYETGNGTAKVMGNDGQFFDMHFKYVNVWKLQTNGEYKVVIDIYNDVKTQ